MDKFENIKLPENIKLETKKTIQKGRVLKRKNKLKNIKIASIGIILLFIYSGYGNYSIAKSIDNLNNLFESISSIRGIPKDYTKYSKGVNLSKTINGVTFSIDDVVYDGHQLNFTYTIQSQNKLPRQNNGFYKDRLMIEEIITVQNGSVTKGSTTGGEYIDDYRYTFMQSYNINFEGEKAPKEIGLDFSLNKIFTCFDSGKIKDTINETFNFKFKISPNVYNNKVIDVNETQNGITVKSLEITPYSITVNVKFPKSMISKSKEKQSSIEISTDYSLELNPKVYDYDLDNSECKIKRGIVYDSIINDNVYNIGYSSLDDYIIVKFKNFNNKYNSDITEFKINLK